MQIKLLICLISGVLVFIPAAVGLLGRAGGRRGKGKGRKAAAVKGPGRWPGWLWAGASFIYEHLPERLRTAGQLKAGGWAQALYPGRKPAELVRSHEVRKVALVYTGLILTWALVSLLLVTAPPSDLPDALLQRNDAGEADAQAQLVARVDEETVPFDLQVHARAYTEEELADAVDSAKAYIEGQLPGENPDLQHVTRPLKMEQAAPDLPFKIEWQPEDYRLIGQDGSLYEPDEVTFPVQTSVTAFIHYRDRTFSMQYPVTITGIMHTAREDLRIRLEAALAAADAATGEKAYLKLPVMLDGSPVIWHYREDMRPLYLAVIGLGLCCGIFYLQDERMRREVARRSEQIRMDYPGFVHQLVLLMGAGLTIGRCWDLIIEDAQASRKSSQESSFLIREMLYARRIMQTGVAETEAIRIFGERMALPGYMRICRILVQMIRTGSRGSREMMMKEAEEAEKHRRDMARKLGETAGTRLLLPMMMLLFIVLAVVMLPAFLSM